MRNKIFNYLFIIWSFVIITLTSIPKLSLPQIETLGPDKIAHFSVYFIFALLFLYRKTTLSAHNRLKILLFMSIIVPLFDELHQIPIPGRMFSYYDLIADICGFYLAIFLFYNHNFLKLLIKPVKLLFSLKK